MHVSSFDAFRPAASNDCERRSKRWCNQNVEHEQHGVARRALYVQERAALSGCGRRVLRVCEGLMFWLVVVYCFCICFCAHRVEPLASAERCERSRSLPTQMLGRSRAKAATAAMARAQNKDACVDALSRTHQIAAAPRTHQIAAAPHSRWWSPHGRYVQPSPPLVDDM